jgi:hypothetical protein
MTETRWKRLAYVYAALAALFIAYYVARIPVQVSDSLGNMLQVQDASYGRLWEGQLYSAGYLRPLLWIQIKAVYDLAHGHYWLMFKAIHALQLLALTLLFVRLLRVRSAAGCAAAAFAIAVLFGIHTFSGTVREAFPINGFLTVIVAVLAVINLAISRHRIVNDLLAPLLLAVVTLQVESGLLIFVAVAGAWIVGFRGVSRWGLGACVALTVAYFYLRFGPLNTGTPGLAERSSGFGFEMLEAPELLERFGANPLPFYIYNVVTQCLSVLFAEPRAGLFYATRIVWSGDELPEWLAVNLVTATALTLLVVPFVTRVVRRWWRDEKTDSDRVTLVALALLSANAVLSFSYTKDVIMSLGGVCFALMAGIAMQEAIGRTQLIAGRRRLLAHTALAALSLGWAVRATALPYLLWEQAFRTRNDWSMVYQWLDDQEIKVETDEARRLVERLRHDALTMPIPHPNMQRPFYARYFDLN